MLDNKMSSNVIRNNKLRIDNYTGKNEYVLRMMAYLSNNSFRDLYGAYVHGSMGSYEEIKYSDFDGVVVIKNDYL